MNNGKFYDLGEVAGPSGRFPTMSKASMAAVMEAVLYTGSRIHDTHVDPDLRAAIACPNGQRTVLYRVQVPDGEVGTFQMISGYALTIPPQVKVSCDRPQLVTPTMFDDGGVGVGGGIGGGGGRVCG